MNKLWLLGFLGFAARFDERLAPLRICYIFFFAPLITDILRARRRRVSSERIPDQPLPAPGARNPILFASRLAVSGLLPLANPRQLRQIIGQNTGQARAIKRVGKVPEANVYVQSVRYTLPFTNEWIVLNGGITEATSHSWDIVAQRYAYDFAMADAAGARHTGDGTRVEHYLAYGQPILAVADGEVVEVRDGVRDAPCVGNGWIDWRSADFVGNRVVIRHAANEFSLAAHLVPGSIGARVGDVVKRGAQIGLCGHSGHSTEPHLHFHVQDHADFFEAVGLPVKFSDVVVDGIFAGAEVYLRAGTRVRSHSVEHVTPV